MDKAIVKLDEIGNELYSKTNISTHLLLKASVADGNLDQYFETTIKPKMLGEYVIFAIDMEHKRYAFYASNPQFLGYFDEDEVWGDATVQLLVAQTKNSAESTNSAAFLNGFSELAEQIAEAKGVELKNTLGNESKYFFQALRYLIWILAILFFGWLIYNKFMKIR